MTTEPVVKLARTVLVLDHLLYGRALALAQKAHDGQYRKYKEPPVPYVTHPIRVAALATRLGLGEYAIAAALLHDVLEDTTVTQQEILAETNVNVLMLVRELTNPKGEGSRAQRKLADRERLRAASSTARTIKALDRFDNLLEILDVGTAPKDFVKLYAEESAALLGALRPVNPTADSLLAWAIQEALDQ